MPGTAAATTDARIDRYKSLSRRSRSPRHRTDQVHIYSQRRREGNVIERQKLEKGGQSERGDNRRRKRKAIAPSRRAFKNPFSKKERKKEMTRTRNRGCTGRRRGCGCWLTAVANATDRRQGTRRMRYGHYDYVFTVLQLHYTAKLYITLH